MLNKYIRRDWQYVKDAIAMTLKEWVVLSQEQRHAVMRNVAAAGVLYRLNSAHSHQSVPSKNGKQLQRNKKKI